MGQETHMIEIDAAWWGSNKIAAGVNQQADKRDKKCFIGFLERDVNRMHFLSRRREPKIMDSFNLKKCWYELGWKSMYFFQTVILPCIRESASG